MSIAESSKLPGYGEETTNGSVNSFTLSHSSSASSFSSGTSGASSRNSHSYTTQRAGHHPMWIPLIKMHQLLKKNQLTVLFFSWEEKKAFPTFKRRRTTTFACFCHHDAPENTSARPAAFNLKTHHCFAAKCTHSGEKQFLVVHVVNIIPVCHASSPPPHPR